MTSTQARYAAHGTSDISIEPIGPYGPNKAHDNDHEPLPVAPAYE